MSESMLLFFDTFVVDNEDKNQMSCIRFANIVSVTEIRIIPFGTVVESRISDEPVFGATNPASFNLKVYGYNDTNSSTFFPLAECGYDESNGIRPMPLPHPAIVNSILLRGNYSTVTVAVFGAPLFPAGLPIPNFSVPPPPLVANAPNYPVPPIIGPTGSMDTHQNQPSQVQSPATSWPKPLGSNPTIDKSTTLPSSPALLHLAFEDKKVESEPSVKEEAETEEKEPDATGSMNVPPRGNLADEAVLSKSVKLLDPYDPLLKPTHWKFDPISIILQPADSLPGVKRKRLPCPTLTLFEIHKWLLTSDCSTDGDDQAAGGGDEEAWSDLPLLEPPLADKATAQKHAERLLRACEEYGTEVDNFRTDRWLDTLEEIIPNLACALAYLSVFRTESYEPTISCLRAWAHCGLQVERALGQPVSTAADGLRHLRAGASLMGALYSAAAPRLLLLPPRHEQRALLDLLECPLAASTPLRLHVLFEGLENTLNTPAGFTAFVGLAEGASDGPSPYQRLVRFLVKTNKSLPVALAGNRVLAKVKFYDTLLQFHDFINNLKSSKADEEEEEEPSLQTEVQREYALQSYLQAISRAIVDPEAVLSPVPKNAPKIKELKPSADVSSVLYRLLDSIHFLDHLVWLLERPTKSSILSATMEATTDVLSKLLSTSSGLLFVASSPQSIDRILRSQLVPEDSQNEKRQLSRLGLELAVKLEALGCVDTLVALTRRKGETGIHRYVASEDTSEPFDPVRSSVFALAQLFLMPTFAPWAAEVLSGAGGDHFVPCLMLLEALHHSDETSKSADNESGKAESDAKMEGDSQEAGESYLWKLGFSGERLELPSLLSIITVGVLRHASNVSYLERLGSRLLRIVQSTQWEDRISSLPAPELFQHHRAFPDAGAPWLSWLREAPSSTLSDNDDLFAFYADQLAPLVEVFEESSHPPPAILLLLRLLRFYSAKSNIFMIELYARDGLANLTALVESAAEWIMTSSSVCALTVDVMAEAVDLLRDLVEALIEGMGGEFRDRTPIKVICKAYAAVSTPSSNRAIIERIQRSVLRCITAYANTDEQLESPEGGEKDLWTLVCRDIFEFITSSPLYFQPGMLLLLDLLPLPLPVVSLQALSPAEKQALISNREWWCRRLSRDLSIEVCGLVELFSASSPASSLHRLLSTFVDRILSLDTQSLLMPQLLASSAAETLIEVYQNAASAASEIGKSGAVSGSGGGGCGESGDPQQQQGEGGEGGSSTGDFVLPSTIKALTPGNRLVLGSQQPPSLPDQVPTSNTSGSAEDALVVDFGSIVDVTEIVHALSLLHFILKHPICKQAFLESLRADAASGSRTTRSQRLLSIFASILEASIPNDASRYHAEAQGKLISCVECLLDRGIGLCREGKESTTTAGDQVKEEDPELFDFVNYLPPVAWLSDLVGGLLTHLQAGSLSGKRNPAVLTRVIDLLHDLAQHDFGFTLIQRHLCQKSQEATFVALLERFSASEASTLLRSFLRLISALLADPIFTEEVVLATQGEKTGTAGGGEQTVGERRLRLPTLRLRQLLAGREENVVGRVVTLLETAIRDAETTFVSSSSLHRLCDGMKSLQNLLGAPGDFSPPTDSVQPLPLPTGLEPLPLTALHRPTINRVISDSAELACVKAELDRCFAQRFSASEGADEAPSRTANLLAYAEQVCPGVDLRADRTRRKKRDVDDADSTIQHKRRKRGQTTDIIQTGRSSKRYVAPMRGRGFSVRQASNSIGVSSLRGGGSGGDSLLVNATGRPDNFRSRPQNTSRPPSMHVDDFNKLAKDESTASTSRDVRETPSHGRDSGGSGGIRGSFRGARGGGMVGTQRVLSSLPFIGSASGSGAGGGTGNSILSTPPVVSANVVVPLQSWTGSASSSGGAGGGGVQQITHHPHLLTLTNPIPPANRSSSSGNMQPPRID